MSRVQHKNFFAFDTETDKGLAFILSVSSPDRDYTYKTKKQADVTQFFADCCSKKWGNIGFAYNLDYDVLAVMKFYGEETILRLYLEKKVIIGDMEIGYIPKKFLYIQKGKNITYIFELMQYFNMSLDNAAFKYLGERKAKIGGKKAKQNILKLYRANPKKITLYCERDAKLTKRLGEKLNQMCETFGLSINKFYSCGYIAKSYMKANDIRFNPLRDESIIDIVKPAYFGGRIEFVQRGYFKKVFQYDINSAYPFAVSKLETIVGYSRRNYIDKSAKYFFANCDIEIKHVEVSPLAYRNDNLIIYPSGRLTQTVDNFTYQTLLREGCIKKVNYVLNVYTDGTKPFYRMVTGLYRERNLKTTPEDVNYIIKIILNSQYGKFAEKRKDYHQLDEETALFLMDEAATKGKGSGVIETEIGYYKRVTEYSKHSNLVYASLITAYIRNYLYQVIKELPKGSYIGSMTDCIFSKSPLPAKYISNKKELGKFSIKENSFCYVVGSGVYCSESGSKLRGYNLKGDLIKMAKQKPRGNVLTIKSTERKGLGKFVVQGVDISEVNVITDSTKNLNLNFDTKREWENGGFKNFGESLKKHITSRSLFLELNNALLNRS